MVLRKAETAAALRFLERGCEWETLAFGERRPDGGRLRDGHHPGRREDSLRRRARASSAIDGSENRIRQTLPGWFRDGR